MQWSLFVLILMGQCSFLTCHLHEYHFVDMNKNWTEAQGYCREHYTDLATVSSMTDVKRLCDSAKEPQEAWIGLHSQPDANGRWQWSESRLELDEKWTWVEWEHTNKHDHIENCGFLLVLSNLTVGATSCEHKGHFICYNDTDQSNKFHVIRTENKNWPDAQKFCRDHHKGLVSGKEQLADLGQSEMTMPTFIDLFRNTWRWSDNSNLSFTHWGPDFQHQPQKQRCAVTMRDGDTWNDDDCDDKKPFFCYDEKVILIKESKTWDEALDYCRKNHHDLASIPDADYQRVVQARAKNADTAFVWLGLRYTCTLDLWFWVNNQLVCYDEWAPGEQSEGCDRAVAMSRDGKWFRKSDNDKFNFVCAV